LDVRRKDAVRMARGQLLERGLLERLRDLDTRRLELARGPPQDACPRILGPVDPVPESHDAFAPVEKVAHVLRDVVGASHLVEHLEDARRSTTMKRARERADGRRHRGGAYGSLRGD